MVKASELTCRESVSIYVYTVLKPLQRLIISYMHLLGCLNMDEYSYISNSASQK